MRQYTFNLLIPIFQKKMSVSRSCRNNWTDFYVIEFLYKVGLKHTHIPGWIFSSFNDNDCCGDIDTEFSERLNPVQYAE